MLVIVNSRLTVVFTLPQVSSVLLSTSYCKFDSDLGFVQSLFTVFCWSGTELVSYFWRFFFGFGVQVQGNPAGGEGIALSLCCGLGTRPGRGGHSSREGRNVKSKRRRIEGVKGVEIPRSARMS